MGPWFSLQIHYTNRLQRPSSRFKVCVISSELVVHTSLIIIQSHKHISINVTLTTKQNSYYNNNNLQKMKSSHFHIRKDKRLAQLLWKAQTLTLNPWCPLVFLEANCNAVWATSSKAFQANGICSPVRKNARIQPDIWSPCKNACCRRNAFQSSECLY